MDILPTWYIKGLIYGIIGMLVGLAFVVIIFRLLF